MKTITKSLIKLSEIPEHLQEIFNGHKIHTYAEFHIDDDCNDKLTLWLIDKYPTIKMKVSFLIHIDIIKKIDAFEQAARPLMEYLGYNHHPHTSAYVASDRAELLEGQKSFITEDYILD